MLSWSPCPCHSTSITVTISNSFLESIYQALTGVSRFSRSFRQGPDVPMGAFDCHTRGSALVERNSITQLVRVVVPELEGNIQ